MELVQPSIGLMFWMTISFLVILFILKKFAWGPILEMIQEREDSIENALESAEKAKQEMASLQADNERILNEARAERDALLKEAREMKDGIIADAKETATAEADRLILAARTNIQNEKNAAIADMKNQVSTLSVDIAEKILKAELSGEEKQQALVTNLLQEISLN